MRDTEIRLEEGLEGLDLAGPLVLHAPLLVEELVGDVADREAKAARVLDLRLLVDALHVVRVHLGRERVHERDRVCCSIDCGCL